MILELIKWSVWSDDSVSNDYYYLLINASNINHLIQNMDVLFNFLFIFSYYLGLKSRNVRSRKVIFSYLVAMTSNGWITFMNL